MGTGKGGDRRRRRGTGGDQEGGQGGGRAGKGGVYHPHGHFWKSALVKLLKW